MKIGSVEPILHPAARGYVLSLLTVLIFAPAAMAQTVFSYVNENGVRVLTNIPPKNALPPAPSLMPNRPDGSEPVNSGDVPERNSARDGQREAATTSSAEIITTPYDAIIEKYAREFRLDPSLVRSIIATESGFNPRAVSRKGARGLMQLMPETASRLGVRNLHDADENIKGGTKYLRSLLDTFDNNLTLSLAAYNAGENLVQRIGRVPNIPETHAYVRSVQKRYGKNEMTWVPPEERRWPSLFRFVDEQGVLHLTDKPPIQRGDGESSSSATGLQGSQ